MLSSLPRNNMVPGAKKITELLLNYLYSAVNPACKIHKGICKHFAKTVSELVRAKSSEIDIVR